MPITETAQTDVAMRSETDLLRDIQKSTEAVRQAIDGMQKVAGSAEKIDEFIEQIDDIAERSRMLALNAALESGRAGDEGNGFRAVADEVGKLAKDITENISGITERINEIKQELHLTQESITTDIK